MTKKIPKAKGFIKTLGRLLGQSDRSFLIEMLPKNSVGAEIGVHKGDFSAQLLQRLEPKELHLIDPWKHEKSDSYKKALYGGEAHGGQTEMDERYQLVCARFEHDRRVKIHRQYSTNALNKFPDEYFDWIYIDGNHLYEFVKQDLEISLQKTKHNGYVTGDDYTSGGWWRGGVKKAVDEFIQTESVRLIEIRNGQFIIKKIA